MASWGRLQRWGQQAAWGRLRPGPGSSDRGQQTSSERRTLERSLRHVKSTSYLDWCLVWRQTGSVAQSIFTDYCQQTMPLPLLQGPVCWGYIAYWQVGDGPRLIRLSSSGDADLWHFLFTPHSTWSTPPYSLLFECSFIKPGMFIVQGYFFWRYDLMHWWQYDLMSEMINSSLLIAIPVQFKSGMLRLFYCSRLLFLIYSDHQNTYFFWEYTIWCLIWLQFLQPKIILELYLLTFILLVDTINIFLCQEKIKISNLCKKSLNQNSAFILGSLSRI